MIKSRKIIALIVICCISIGFTACTKSIDTAGSDLTVDNVSILELSLSTQYQPCYNIYIDEDYNYSLYINQELVECTALDKSQIETISSFIDEFNSTDVENDDFIFDYWTVTVKTDSKDIQFTYGYSGAQFIDDGIDTILSFTSEKLVDANGNDIKKYDTTLGLLG